MPKLLLITGGKHPYEETTPVLTRFLSDAGHEVDVSESATELSGDLSAYDAIVLNTLRQPDTDNDLDTNQRDGLMGYVWTGGGLVSVHISAASCPDWEHMKPMTGGGWILGESWHPPFGWFQVHIENAKHPIAEDTSDFWTYDECYCGLDIQPDIDVFMHGRRRRRRGAARLVTQLRRRQGCKHRARTRGVKPRTSPISDTNTQQRQLRHGSLILTRRGIDQVHTDRLRHHRSQLIKPSNDRSCKSNGSEPGDSLNSHDSPNSGRRCQIPRPPHPCTAKRPSAQRSPGRP